jgi:hypothetical protein
VENTEPEPGPVVTGLRCRAVRRVPLIDTIAGHEGLLTQPDVSAEAHAVGLALAVGDEPRAQGGPAHEPARNPADPGRAEGGEARPERHVGPDEPDGGVAPGEGDVAPRAEGDERAGDGQPRRGPPVRREHGSDHRPEERGDDERTAVPKAR